MVVQPTGSGKSLFYQFPPLVTHKMTRVVTPTISLLADQSLSLSAKGICTTFLGSAPKDFWLWIGYIKESAMWCMWHLCLFNTGGELQYPFTKHTKERRIGLVAVDEAHLVRSGIHSGMFNWHVVIKVFQNFRAQYLYVQKVHRFFPGCPIIALTVSHNYTNKWKDQLPPL